MFITRMSELLITLGSIGKYFASEGRGGSDALDVDYNVDLGGGGGAEDDVTSFGGATHEEREARRAEAEDFIPPEERERSSRRSEADDEHEELPEDREDRGGRRDVARERQQREARGDQRDQQGERGRDGRRERGRKPDDLPDHRYDQLNQKFDRTMRMLEGQLESERRQNRRFRMALGLGEAREPRRYTEKEQRIRTQLERTYPELSLLSNRKLHQLIERFDDLDRVVTEYPERGREETRRWGGHAERMVRAAQNHAAQQWLGKGKSLKDLDEDDRDEIDHAFSRWVTRRSEREERDLPDGHYGETTLRYESGDPSLVTEFFTHYTRRHGAAGPGGMRREGAAAAARADAASRTARGGSSSAPLGSARREQKRATLDDAVEEAWSYVQNERAGA
ncbi:MAG: hypothetical protein ACRD3G_11425 [Vicinamibacterales bacterium]